MSTYLAAPSFWGFRFLSQLHLSHKHVQTPKPLVHGHPTTCIGMETGTRWNYFIPDCKGNRKKWKKLKRSQMEAGVWLPIRCSVGLNSSNQNKLSLRKLSVTNLQLSKEQPNLLMFHFLRPYTTHPANAHAFFCCNAFNFLKITMGQSTPHTRFVLNLNVLFFISFIISNAFLWRFFFFYNTRHWKVQGDGSLSWCVWWGI